MDGVQKVKKFYIDLIKRVNSLVGIEQNSFTMKSFF